MGDKNDKLDYVKPQAVDLGEVAPIFGVICQPSGLQALGNCQTGTLAKGQCSTGGQGKLGA